MANQVEETRINPLQKAKMIEHHKKSKIVDNMYGRAAKPFRVYMKGFGNLDYLVLMISSDF